MSQLKIGLIGNGSISESHLLAYQSNPKAQIIAICDLNESRAQAGAKKFNAPHVYTDYRDLLANPEIDAISICTWNNSHAEISIAALEAGKHVLCEKPLCKTVDEALQVEAAVRRTGKLLQVGYVRRHASNISVLKKFIDNGDLGEIYFAKASLTRRLGNPGGWFADKERSGGGPLIDIGVHVIDLCWYLMGKPKVKSVSGNTYNKLGNRSNVENYDFYKASDFDASLNTVEDMANAMIRFENGASLMVDVSFTLHAKQDSASINVYGDKGGAEIEPTLSIATEKHNTIINIEPQITTPGFDFQGAFQNEINHYIDSCLGIIETNSPVEDGVEIIKILNAIYESAATGREIHF
ncbi:putative dehydrogenase [Paenibacillus anaericanus]|uniref:Gfo/Idh/MocA family oxidoreductase n=1 Tax=Paenibacillus anaericanus TaxID=170367 RepID=A0A3S1DN35_9BACL|nr:Gfo/Idh/MocA family oxidoreductase [Paenibacillus anaericanus]MDQ0089396.1 putative dehydrogenase [Paenibacillus anaericanus]RUT45145.1 Gfo/Idh/MocA family oxidoreductase [Paenibacillus anaericanus]